LRKRKTSFAKRAVSQLVDLSSSMWTKGFSGSAILLPPPLPSDLPLLYMETLPLVRCPGPHRSGTGYALPQPLVLRDKHEKNKNTNQSRAVLYL